MKKVLIVLMAFAVAATSFAGQKDWPEKVRFSVIPTASQSSMNSTFGNLIDFLNKKLGVEVELKNVNDYAAVITGMQYGHIDCAYFGPKSYVEAAKRAKAEALTIEVSQDGSRGYYGYIITKKGSGLKTLADIKGKKWAFTDPNSTSGTLVPTVFFAKKSIDPHKYFGKVIYSGSHEASIISVKNGKVDAASTNDLDFMRGLGKHWKKSDFNIIWVSDLIPGAPMTCRSDMPESFKMAMKGALVSYADKAGLETLKISGYAPVTDDAYNSVRELIEMKKQLKAKKK